MLDFLKIKKQDNASAGNRNQDTRTVSEQSSNEQPVVSDKILKYCIN